MTLQNTITDSSIFIFNNNFMIEKEGHELIHNKHIGNSRLFEILHDLKGNVEVDNILSSFRSGSIITKTKGQNFLISFQNIVNFDNVPVAFILAVEEDNFKTDLIVKYIKFGIMIYAIILFVITLLIIAIKDNRRIRQQHDRIDSLLEETKLANDMLTSLNKDLNQKNSDLEEARKKIKVLSGTLPVCSYCKKIRDSEGKWFQLESYIDKHSEAQFSHTICPVCMEKEFHE